ncbi:SdpA family antimicrobial peptide system protein [Streptomyces sp. Rer75]|uniref:SdpA family antimicrobial peptide system protein n=1 Tax=Streptomyces sp. Rer75 TaxID=2750011 RepID=UPI0015D0414B|nr:SdpA family antimicrobial peptide system protein [Streptomyces sp. Rer75]QLH25342.1 SdpA family antimicrobial peptide system protein [Streptomyces sp. Rer75]WTB09142.1 SdpA family antimicrobial peptide system protein [Streptomyces antimycoticus]
MPRQKDRQDRLLLTVESPRSTVGISRRWVMLAAVAWLLPALYVIQTHLPGNALTLPGQDSAAATVNRVAPQGWSFFTKSPRGSELQPFVLRDGVWEDRLMAPHGAPHNAFGLNRRSRSQGIEMALLLAEAEGLRWTKCDRDLSACLGSAKAPGKVANREPEPTLCGRVALVEQKPVPFAWRNLMDAPHTPDRLTVLDVTC